MLRLCKRWGQQEEDKEKRRAGAKQNENILTDHGKAPAHYWSSSDTRSRQDDFDPSIHP